LGEVQRLPGVVSGVVQQNFDALNQRLGLLEQIFSLGEAFLGLAVLGDRKLAFGTSALTFSGGTTSSLKTVTHGLGTAPAVVIPITFAAGAFGSLVTFNIAAKEETTFSVNGETKSATGPGNVTFDWIAIG
jgi:hypothetical protein